jgi:hypothetical protein
MVAAVTMNMKAATTIEVERDLTGSNRLNIHQRSNTMDRNTANKKKRGSRTGETKILIGALAFTSALGFWNLFAHQAITDLASAGQSQDNTTGDVTSPEVSTNRIVLNLPPLPTLVPDLASTAMDLQPIPTAPAVVNVVSSTAIQQPTKILMGGAQPGAAQPSAAKAPAKRSAPAPVTSTRSSQ